MSIQMPWTITAFGYSVKNILMACSYLFSAKSRSLHSRNRLSRVEFFSEDPSLLKTLQQNEKIRSDSAFDKGTAIQISATCKMLLIPSVSFKVNNRFQHLSGVTFDRNLFTCAIIAETRKGALQNIYLPTVGIQTYLLSSKLTDKFHRRQGNRKTMCPKTLPSR